MRPIVFLTGWDRDCQAILLGCERTSGVRRHRTRRIVSSVEIDHHGSIHDRIGFQKAPARVGVGFAGQIVENEREALRGIATQVRESYFLAVDLKHDGPCYRGW